MFRENHAGEIRLLQKFNEPPDDLLVMSGDIEKNAAAVASKHDVSWFRFVREFGLRSETGVIQNFPQIDRTFDGRETVI